MSAANWAAKKSAPSRPKKSPADAEWICTDWAGMHKGRKIRVSNDFNVTGGSGSF
jgi:hypothetical protein